MPHFIYNSKIFEEQKQIKWRKKTSKKENNNNSKRIHFSSFLKKWKEEERGWGGKRKKPFKYQCAWLSIKCIHFDYWFLYTKKNFPNNPEVILKWLDGWRSAEMLIEMFLLFRIFVAFMKFLIVSLQISSNRKWYATRFTFVIFMSVMDCMQMCL